MVLAECSECTDAFMECFSPVRFVLCVDDVYLAIVMAYRKGLSGAME
jgi:hypothetical protein